jgi:hypothetical protein
MKAMALSGVFVLASAGLVFASGEAPAKPEAAFPVTAEDRASLAVKSGEASTAQNVVALCEGAAADTSACVEATAKN